MAIVENRKKLKKNSITYKTYIRRMKEAKKKSYKTGCNGKGRIQEK